MFRFPSSRSTRPAQRGKWLVAGAILCITAPVLAETWQASAPLHATIHAHVFDQVDNRGQGCTLTTKLYFTAPPEAYRSDAPVRNHYRFKARVQFKNGKVIESGVFYSRGPARRSYTLHRDTKNEGCWARFEQQPSDVRIEGCRGEGCRVLPFAD